MHHRGVTGGEAVQSRRRRVHARRRMADNPPDPHCFPLAPSLPPGRPLLADLQSKKKKQDNFVSWEQHTLKSSTTCAAVPRVPHQEVDGGENEDGFVAPPQGVRQQRANDRGGIAYAFKQSNLWQYQGQTGCRLVTYKGLQDRQRLGETHAVSI
eukprot:1152674-Pelagomonas_calceolata.AAC.2